MRPTLAMLVAVAYGILPARGAAPTYKPATESQAGNELAFVFIGSTTCGFCNDPAVKAAVREAKATLATRAAAEHRPFSATGVALDRDLKAGLAYLERLGPFDQVIAGRDWLNSAVLDLMAEGDDAFIGIPQVIVYERLIESRGAAFTASRPKIVARIPGTAIPMWVQFGTKIDSKPPEKTTPATSP